MKYVVKSRKNKSVCRRVLLIYRVIDSQACRFSARRAQFKPQIYLLFHIKYAVKCDKSSATLLNS